MSCINRVSRISTGPYLALLLIVSAMPLFGQQPAATSNVVVPPLVNFSSVLTDVNGKPLTNLTGVTFLVYEEEQGGVPLWLETQNVQPNKNGRYSVMLGSTTNAGLRADIFVAGEARWLAVQPEGQPEQPRIMLVSVPYALKASDADTLGGMPASAFALAPTASASGTSASLTGTTKPNAGKSAVNSQNTISGSANYIPIFSDNAGDLGNSNIFQSASGNVGIGWNTPQQRLVIGAPAGGGVLNASNLSDQDMQISLTAPGASDKHAFFGTSTPTNLTLGVNGAEKMRITNSGNVGIGWSNPQQRLVIGAPTGGGALNASNLSDQDMQIILTAPGATDKHAFFGTSTATNLTLGVTGTEMMRITNTGAVGIGTSTPGATLEVNGTAKFDNLVTFAAGQTYAGVPLLAANNVFTGNQTVNGSLSATGAVTASSYQIGSNLFAFGSYSLANAFLGFGGNAATTGSYNTATGAYSLISNSSGGDNTANGYYALGYNTTGGSNTALGAMALAYNSTGGANTSTGSAALFVNITGNNNTANGYQALFKNSSGSNNTANGFEALYSNTVPSGNVAVGYQALYSNVGDSSYDGWYNTAVGTGALYANNDTSGTGENAQENTGLGYHALYSNTTGSFSTAVGYMAASASNQWSNTAVGSSAMLNTTSGGSNTAIGAGALAYNTTGQTNTAIGASALSGSNGDYNIAIGVQAGSLLTYGSDNIDIGNPGTATEESDTIRIGASQKATYIAGIYNANAGGNYVYINSSGRLSSLSSSRRFKQDIVDLGDTTNIVMRLRPVRFRYKSQGEQGPEQYGLIAEEVNEIAPEMVGRGQDGQIDSVHYDKLNILLLSEVQKQHRLLETQKKQLQSKISRLQQQIHAQQARIEEQRAALKAQAKESQIHQAEITRLDSQIMAIQLTLKTLGPGNSEVRAAKANVAHP